MNLLRCHVWIRIEGAITEVCRCMLIHEHDGVHKFNVPGDVTRGVIGQVTITQLEDPRDPA